MVFFSVQTNLFLFVTKGNKFLTEENVFILKRKNKKSFLVESMKIGMAIVIVKLRYCEKAKRFEKNHHPLTFDFYSIASNL